MYPNIFQCVYDEHINHYKLELILCDRIYGFNGYTYFYLKDYWNKTLYDNRIQLLKLMTK